MKIDLGKFLEAAQVIAPYALQLAGVPVGLIPLVQYGISNAEAFYSDTDKTGADKKAFALNQIANGLDAVSVAHPNQITGPLRNEILASVSQGIDATITGIRTYHAIAEAKANTGNGVPNPPQA